MASPLLSRLAPLGRPSTLRTVTTRTRPSQWIRRSSSSQPPRPSGARKYALLAAAALTGTGAVVAYYAYRATLAAPEIQKAEIVYEKPRKKAATAEEGRDLVSSQHQQVKNSWEHPGVYAWGSNAGRVVAPDSKESVIKTPRRISYFDGQILRDLKLDRDFGAAVTENGDLVQWGAAFSKDSVAPVVTLKGKDISKIAVSRDRIIALASNGSVYSIPVASSDQALGEKPASQSSGLWSSAPASTSYRSLKPEGLGWGEKVVDVKSGLEHCLLLTSKGRVFSAASSAEEFPSRGQLGIPGLTWQTRTPGPYDQPHEIKALSGANIKAIAAGAFHSLALDNQGRVFAFGDNTLGQLGLETDSSAPAIDTPSPLPITKLYSGTDLHPKVTSIAAGGMNSFLTVDAAKPHGPTAAETWAFGSGIHGGLGTGKWTHISSKPTKIKSLSNLAEYSETTNTLTPIRLANLSVGATHACAVLANATHLTTTPSSSSSATDTNYGADVLWWGGNENYQLGTGRRSNVAVPTYIGPLDRGRGGEEEKRLQITPRMTVRVGEGGRGRRVSVEQRVVCGREVTGVYSGA